MTLERETGFIPSTHVTAEEMQIDPSTLATDEYGIAVFKENIKLKIMTESDKYCASSPFCYVN